MLLLTKSNELKTKIAMLFKGGTLPFLGSVCWIHLDLDI